MKKRIAGLSTPNNRKLLAGAGLGLLLCLALFTLPALADGSQWPTLTPSITLIPSPTVTPSPTLFILPTMAPATPFTSSEEVTPVAHGEIEEQPVPTPERAGFGRLLGALWPFALALFVIGVFVALVLIGKRFR
jgi:hypothetical protein